MAKRFSPAAIGTFIVAAFALFAAAVIVIGSGHLFRKPIVFVCMFQGDLNGLKVGAPVKFRGVQIGTVSAIKFILSPSEGRLRRGSEMRLPVFIEIDRQQITSRGGTGQALNSQGGLQDFIKRGMRAQLNMESLLTGLLYIDLNLHPDTPVDLALEPGSGPYPEIPTIPTTLEAAQDRLSKALTKLEKIDFQAMANSIAEAADSIRDLTSSPNLKATIGSLKDTTANLNEAVISMRQLIERTDVKLDPLIAGLQKNSEELNATMIQTRGAVADLKLSLDPDSPLLVNLSNALDQLTETTRSIGDFTNYLQRNPSSLIRGKYISDNHGSAE